MSDHYNSSKSNSIANNHPRQAVCLITAQLHSHIHYPIEANLIYSTLSELQNE